MRKFFLIALAVCMAVVAVATWGSIGSVTMIFGLILMAASLVYQHFLTNRAENDYDIHQ